MQVCWCPWIQPRVCNSPAAATLALGKLSRAADGLRCDAAEATEVAGLLALTLQHHPTDTRLCRLVHFSGKFSQWSPLGSCFLLLRRPTPPVTSEALIVTFSHSPPSSSTGLPPATSEGRLLRYEEGREMIYATAGAASYAGGLEGCQLVGL